MDGVGEVDGGGACRQGHDLTLGGKDKDLVVEHIHLQRLDIVLGVIFLLLALQQAAHPFKVLLIAAFDALLVLPVGGNAVFRRFVHLPGADLHLEGDALLADDGGVEALIHIGLGGGDIVLEASGDQVEQVVDVAQDVVAVGDGVDDDAEGVQVVKLVDGFFLGLHLAVDGVDVLDAAVDGAVDAHCRQPRGDLALDGPHEIVGLLLVVCQILHDLVVARRVQIF